MAIQDDTQGSAANNEQVQQPQSARAPQRAAPATMSFHTGALFAAPISRTVGSENYSKLKTNLAEIFKAADEQVEIALIDLDNVNEPALAFSSIIVALRLKNNPKAGVAYHILMLASTGDKLTPIFETINSQQIEILRVTSDAVDDVLMKKAQEKVQKAFPNQAPWRVCDGTVVPANFNVEDKFAVHQLALNAGLACSTELQVCSEGFQDLNLVNLAHDSSLNVNIGFTRSQIPDALGSPMRSDILVNFSSKRNVQGGKYASVNSGDKEVKVYEASAFTDLVWAPASPQSAYNAWMPQQQLQTQKYIARLVVTNLASQMSYTPASVLLALVAAQTVREDNNWIQTFRPTPASNEIDMTDIGAVNIEANLMNEPNFGTRIDTKADSFKLADLGKLVAALVQPGMIVSLDCPEYGPQTWYTSVFMQAANGNGRAIDIIYEAANQLTGGNFARHFPAGSAMFVDSGNRIHLGTYTDRQGNKKDIRDIDHIAVCNLSGERNPQAIRDWSDTFLRVQFPLAQRLAARKRMISAFTGETAQFDGFAQRVTFSRAFMEALTVGVRETNLAVRINTPLSGADFNDQRGVAGFASAALMVPGQTFLNNGGFGFAPQLNQGMGGNNYRF